MAFKRVFDKRGESGSSTTPSFNLISRYDKKDRQELVNMGFDRLRRYMLTSWIGCSGVSTVESLCDLYQDKFDNFKLEDLPLYVKRKAIKEKKFGGDYTWTLLSCMNKSCLNTEDGTLQN